MAKIQAVWAIDIGQAALKALKLVPGETADQVVAEAFDFIEYPKILSQPDADAEELVREALMTFLGRNDVKGSKVAIAVPGQAGLVKFIKLPPVEKKRIPDIVKFEAKQQIPFALEEVIWDYQQIGGDEDEGDEGFTMAEVGLFAMKRDQINRAILPLKNAGIEVDIVQMGPIALYNYASYDHPRGKDGEAGSIVLLDVGADNTDLIITDGKRIWQRNVPIGGNHFTRALTKELKLTFAKAEHLKRNATKAPDPRAVFTAMRGIFNDFASEVSRSVGFYSSVNRQAKIIKVIGLGNGFKLPGLQKFLQQNLNLSADVERLETFNHLSGDDVIAAPQFQENLLSFAVAYGLGVQGLGLGPLKTNLLPPEIEQVRMIRRKKPWALAASALMLLGFTSLFISDWNAWAKVTSDKFKSAVEQAKGASSRGAKFKKDYEDAKAAFNGKLEEGTALVSESSEAASWPALLAKINATMPDPVVVAKQVGKLTLDADDPSSVEVLRDLRVHIDAIKPVFRTNLQTEWFDALDPQTKDRMHALDRSQPPTGEGWVIQIVGHHYNPSPIGTYATRLSAREKKVALGPITYLLNVVLPRFWDARLRVDGIHHAALAWATIDPKWVTAKVAGSNPLPPAPLMARASAPASSGTGAAGGEGMDRMARMGGMSNMMSFMGGSGAMSSGGGAMSRMMGGGDGMNSMMAGAGGDMMSIMGGNPSAKAKTKAQELMLTRTDFLIQFVWQPPDPEKAPKDAEEARKQLEDIVKQLADAQAKSQGAIKAFTPDEEAQFTKKSEMTAKKVEEARQAATAQMLGNSGVLPPTPAPATGAPATAPAPPGTNPPAPVPGPATPPAPTPGGPAPAAAPPGAPK